MSKVCHTSTVYDACLRVCSILAICLFNMYKRIWTLWAIRFCVQTEETPSCSYWICQKTNKIKNTNLRFLFDQNLKDLSGLSYSTFQACVFSIMFLSLVEETLRDEVEEYTKTCRGKELPGFVNYRTFENIVKKHVQELEEPAIELLRDIIGKYCTNNWTDRVHFHSDETDTFRALPVV